MNASDLSEAVVDRVADLLNQRIGLRPEPNLRGRLRRGIRDDAAVGGLGIERYLAELNARADVFQSLCNRVTVQETGFFRHPEHFEVLAREILPGLSQPVSIWSAGCANGQEAYSLAMLLQEHGIDGSVVATDLSSIAVQRTSTGRYTRRELTGLSPGRIARHLREETNGWRITPELRDRVRTLEHNLIDPIPQAARGCQIVLCRNVLIYFSAEHARALLHRLADSLPPGGTLFLGAAESLWQTSDRFTTVRTGTTFLYRPAKCAGNLAASPGLPAAPYSAPVRSPTRDRARTTTDDRRQRRRVLSQLVQPAESATAPLQSARGLDRTGQHAMAAGDHGAAIVAFRMCTYLTPGDAIAHLHLGLACEAAGDRRAAHLAYGVSRRVLLEPGGGAAASHDSGYTTAELLKFFDHKEEAP